MPLPTRTYRDLDLSFSLHPTTKDVSVLSDTEAVKRSIKNLVLTNFYEVPFQPRKGCGVTSRLFDPVSSLTSQQIKQDIMDAVKYYEPRAKFVEVFVTEYCNASNSYVYVSGIPDMTQYRIDITFQVVNLVQPVEMSLFLKRTR